MLNYAAYIEINSSFLGQTMHWGNQPPVVSKRLSSYRKTLRYMSCHSTWDQQLRTHMLSCAAKLFWLSLDMKYVSHETLYTCMGVQDLMIFGNFMLREQASWKQLAISKQFELCYILTVCATSWNIAVMTFRFKDCAQKKAVRVNMWASYLLFWARTQAGGLAAPRTPRRITFRHCFAKNSFHINSRKVVYSCLFNAVPKTVMLSYAVLLRLIFISTVSGTTYESLVRIPQ